jgi:1-acyl-sn-glycerol-3-phosphate acyltransferase
MGGLMILLCALFLFLRSQIVLRIVSLAGPQAAMRQVSSYQGPIARKLFWFARLFSGLRLRTECFRGPPLPRVFLLISNHQSLVDIPALIVAMRRRDLRFVAKKELGRRVPYVSLASRIGGHALISRTGDFGAGKRELQRFAELCRDGICPVVFPEGTRSRTGDVNEFYAGAVRIILEHASVPVLSVAVDGGYHMSTAPRLLRSLRAIVYRVKPLSLYPAPRGKREIMELLGRVQQEITAQVESWRIAEGRASRRA